MRNLQLSLHTKRGIAEGAWPVWSVPRTGWGLAACAQFIILCYFDAADF